MSRELGGIFADLGLSQYLDAFVDQGFDAWDTILDIQESDLDALGVKLGHRRPDENAPERPPSAYVLFSNKMRDDLKSQSLTFTEIAKLVGENWQSLQPADKEIYENQANAAKEKFHQQLAEYKKTSNYQKYTLYLHEFKERQAKQRKGQNSSKRTKTEPARMRHGSTSSSATPNTISGSSASSSEVLGSEPPPSRRERVDSMTSVTGSQYSSAAPTPISAQHPYDDSSLSPRTLQFDKTSPKESQHRSCRQASTMCGNARTESIRQHLPSLCDMLDTRQTYRTHSGAATSSDGNSYMASQTACLSGRRISNLPSTRAPTLRHESSSISTQSCGGSVVHFGRPYADGPLPIHSLLSDRSADRSSSSGRRLSPIISGGSGGAANRQKPPPLEFTQGPSGYGN
ncbi:hypothetical protein E4U42_003501 [Claviceps africana]|uniref:HMG box domain-containing protein n=1 Tax=Claviceps africana TaxID=83212 RepID=A0A8K0J951_9HYPO|nr:hypothetical protein E4U42_003501 [Claviceps africana]